MFKSISMKKLGIIVGSFVLSVYLLGVVIFSFVVLPNTKLNDSDISYLIVEDVFNKDWTDYSINLKRSDGKSDFFKPVKIEYRENYGGETKFKQNQFLWPISFFTHRDVKLDVTPQYDEAKFNEFLKNTLILKGMKHPEDARIVFENGEYVIKDEVLGTFMTKDQLKEAIIKALLERKETLDLTSVVEQPKITKDNPELKSALEKYGKISKLQYTFLIGDNKEVLEGELLSNIFVFADGNLKPDEQKARDYVRNLAIKYDTFKTDRKFQTTGKGEIVVPGKDGIYGWQFDVNKTKDLLIEKMNTLESSEITPVYLNKGFYYKGEDDIGKTYIEIDLSRQHMWYYIDGALFLETPIVTGDVGKKVETPVGVMKVWSRDKDKNLKGLSPEGYDYVTHVDYWMPINWSGVGIHDAKWRNGKFGGEIYKSEGSYGCVNTPTNAVEQIFNNVKIDTPVIVYKSK